MSNPDKPAATAGSHNDTFTSPATVTSEALMKPAVRPMMMDASPNVARFTQVPPSPSAIESADTKQTQPIQQVSSLLDLPAELWARIGKMVIDQLPSINLVLSQGITYKTLADGRSYYALTTRELDEEFGPRCYVYMQDSTSFKDIATSPEFRTPAVLQVCRALRAELRLYYYSRNTIRVTIEGEYALPEGDLRVAGAYLQMIGPEARQQLTEFWVREDACDDSTIEDSSRVLASEDAFDEELFGVGKDRISHSFTLDQKPCSHCAAARDCDLWSRWWRVTFLN